MWRSILILLYPCNLVGYLRLYLIAVAFQLRVVDRMLVASSPAEQGLLSWRVGVLCLAWALDAVDGPLARRLGHTTRYGGVLDGLCDICLHSLNALTGLGFNSSLARLQVSLEAGVAFYLFGVKQSFQNDNVLRHYFANNQRNPFSAYSNLGRFALPLLVAAPYRPTVALRLTFTGGFLVYGWTTGLMALNLAGHDWIHAYLLATAWLTLVSGRRAIACYAGLLLCTVLRHRALTHHSLPAPAAIAFIQLAAAGISTFFIYVGVGGLLAPALPSADPDWVRYGSDWSILQQARELLPLSGLHGIYLSFHPLIGVTMLLSSPRYVDLVLRTFVACCISWLMFPVLGPVAIGHVRPVVDTWLVSSGSALPSSHCAVSVACARAIWRSYHVRHSEPVGGGLLSCMLTPVTVAIATVLAGAITISTVLSKQHYVMDALLGVLLALILPAPPHAKHKGSGAADWLARTEAVAAGKLQ
eukprot:g52618.t1